MTAFSKDVALDQLNTFRVKARASNFLTVDSIDQLHQLAEEIASFDNRFILGGGSNLLFVDDYQGLVIYPQLKGIEVLEETEQQVTLKVAASENWHEFVQYCLKLGYFGLENLALIPGTVGAAPVQNIGAYGVEVEQFIDRVECFDLQQQKVISLSHPDCEFEYRDSLIKRSGQGRFLVTSVELTLSKVANLVLSYKPLKTLFRNRASVSPQDVFEQVCNLRNQKLPNPKELPNAGSFFKNPIVSKDRHEQLINAFPDLVSFPAGDSGEYKIAAGWMIEKAGFKGKVYNKVGVHKDQALVLVNYSDLDGANIWELAKIIMTDISQRFGISLEPEVRVLGAKCLS